MAEALKVWICVSLSSLVSSISGSDFVDMCTQSSRVGSSIHIYHSAISSSSFNDRCTCIITPDNCNTSATLRFRAVDIRLHNINKNLSECSRESRLELVGQKEIKTYNCEQNHFLHGYMNLHQSRENSLVLYLHKKQKIFPQHVWMEVSSKCMMLNNWAHDFPDHRLR